MALKDTAGGIVNGAALLGSYLGIGEKRQDQRQLRQDRKLGEQAVGRSKELADYEQALKMKMWNDTNYSAQLKAAEKAGVSKVAAIGGGGAGVGQGASVNSASGTGAADAASTANANTNRMMANAQLGLMTAQTANINADTANKEAVTENTGADTTKKGVETNNLRIEGEMKKIDLLTKGMTQQTTIDSIKASLEKTQAEITKLNAEGLIGQNEAQYLQQTFTTRVAQTIQNLAKTSGEIELNKQQAITLVKHIQVEYAKLDFAKLSLDQQKQIVADTLDSMIQGKWIDAGSRIVGDLINLIPNVKGIFGKVEDMVSKTETDTYDKDGNHTGTRVTTTTGKKNTGKK